MKRPPFALLSASSRTLCARILPRLSLLLLVAAPLTAPYLTQAEEGMWRLDQLDALAPQLKASGITTSSSLLANLQQGPAGAVVSMAGGTASFVSADGLLLTNHHVAYDAIQMNSDAEHDFLTFGFQAPTRDRELPAPGYRAYLLKGVEDVTTQLQQAAATTTEGDDRSRFLAIERRQKELVAACELSSGLRCEVVSFDHGLQYRLMKNLELRDIRLVYAPPVGVGDFGGEIDNFMWPRHAGDFSFMRAYVGQDGKPADYAPDNKPFHPEVVLRPAAVSPRLGDPVQIFGYPYVTNRHQTAASMGLEQNLRLPEYVRFTADRIALIQAASSKNRERAIRLAAEEANLGNGLKLTTGKLIAMRRTGVVAARAKEEAAILDWIEADPARKARYGTLLPALNQLIAESEQEFPLRTRLRHLYASSALLEVADTLLEGAEQRQKPDLERLPSWQARSLPALRQYLEQLQRDLDLPLQQTALTNALIEALELPVANRLKGLSPYFSAPRGEHLTDAEKKRVQAQVKQWFNTTHLDELQTRMHLFDRPQLVVSNPDPLLKLARALRVERLKLQSLEETRQGAWERLFPQWLEAWQAFDPRPHYSDANSTLRYTYGLIQGYSSGDAVSLAAFSTVRGVLEKHTGKPPFNAPARLLEEGPASQNLPVDFLATVDTTGGNSGSPVLNGAGELVGLLFDGNYESTGDEFVFWDEKQRSICVDLRYIHWMISRVDRVKGLQDELAWPPLSNGP